MAADKKKSDDDPTDVGQTDKSAEDDQKKKAREDRDADLKSKWDTENLKYDLKLNHHCEWKKAINWHPKFTGTFGYVLAWNSSGGGDLTADLTLVDPSQGASGATLTCVAVIEDFKFDGSPDDPILIIAYVSSANASNIRGKFLAKEPDTSCQVSWNIVKCEGAGEGWYQAAWTDGNVSAQILTDKTKENPGGVLRIAINPQCDILSDTNGTADAVDIRLFKFGFQLVPEPGGSADLQFASAKGAQFTRAWGGDDGGTE